MSDGWSGQLMKQLWQDFHLDPLCGNFIMIVDYLI